MVEHSSFQSDRETVLTAVAQNDYAIQYADQVPPSDREIVLGAAAQDGSALQYANEALQSDREFVLASLARIGYASSMRARTSGATGRSRWRP